MKGKQCRNALAGKPRQWPEVWGWVWVCWGHASLHTDMWRALAGFTAQWLCRQSWSYCLCEEVFQMRCNKDDVSECEWGVRKSNTLKKVPDPLSTSWFVANIECGEPDTQDFWELSALGQKGPLLISALKTHEPTFTREGLIPNWIWRQILQNKCLTTMSWFPMPLSVLIWYF